MSEHLEDHRTIRAILNKAAGYEAITVENETDHKLIHSVIRQHVSLTVRMKPDHVDDHNQIHEICNDLEGSQ